MKVGMAAVLAIGLTGCSNAAPSVDPVAPCDPCLLTDDHNYRYAPTLRAATVDVAPLEDVEIGWAGLTRDLQGRDVAPGELDRATLVVTRELDAASTLDALAHDRLPMSDVRIVLFCDSPAQHCLLSEFSLGGNLVDPSQYLTPGPGTWLIAAGRSEATEVASFAVLRPVDGARSPERVEFTPDTATLDVRVDLTSPSRVTLDPVALPVVDWSGVTVDALGNAVELSRFDRLELAQVPLSPEALEEQFLALDSLKAVSYTSDVAGLTSYPLSTLTGGQALASGGTWLLALRCSTCRNPAPRFLTVLDLVETS